MGKVMRLWKRAWFALVIAVLVGCGSDQGSAGARSGTPAVGTTSEQLCSNPGLTASVSSYVANPGTSVTWTATASCTLANPQYRFVYADPSNTWVQARDWSTSSTFVWDTT